MNTKKLSIGIAAVLAGAVLARFGGPRLGMTGHAVGAPAEVAAPTGNLQEALESQLTGKLAVTVVEQDGTGYRVRAELQDTKFVQTPAPKEEVASLISKPFYFTVMPNGEMQSFYFAKGLSTDDRTLLKQLATSMQAVMPSSPRADWTTVEQDVSGQYAANYSADGNRITRTKGKVLQANGLGGLMPIPAGMTSDVQSTTEYELAPSGWARQVLTNESYDVHLAQSEIAISTRTTLSLGDVASRPDLIGHMPDGVEAESISNARSAEERQHLVDTKAVEGRSFEDLLQALQSPEKHVRDEVLARLPPFFRVNPDALSKAEAVALRGLKDEMAVHRLIYTIGKTGTPQSEATLVRLLQSNNVERQLDAAVTLGLLEKPSSGSGDALIRALTDREPRVMHAALLAIGNMARRVSLEADQTHGNTIEHLVGTVVEQLKGARDDFGRKLAIDALGNSGHPQTFAVVEPYLGSQNAQLRGAAIEALRFIPGEAADKAIIAALDDKDVSIRTAAVKTIGTRPVTALIPALTQLMKMEKNKDIQFAVVHSLNARVGDGTDVTTLLQSIAQSNPRDQVRALAKQMLATN